MCASSNWLGHGPMANTTGELIAAHPEIDVWAAGGVVWRQTGTGAEVLVAHRPEHRDWTFPKGKVDGGETLRRCARREVEEETGYRCRTAERLPLVTYNDARDRRKAVVYWVMTVQDGAFAPNHEVDAIGWFDLASAAAVLSYRRDVELLAAAAALIASPTVGS